MRSTNRLALLAIPALLLALSGCAGASAVAESATTPSATQVKELEGGVTQPEYEAAFQRFSDCMSESGSDLVAVEKNDYLITYSYSGEAAADGSY